MDALPYNNGLTGYQLKIGVTPHYTFGNRFDALLERRNSRMEEDGYILICTA